MHVSISKSARGYMKESTSSSLSELQEKYRSLFKQMCEERSIQHPFELDDAGVKDFFSEISTRWAAEKRK